MKRHHTYPHLYEVACENAQWSMPARQLCAKVNDFVSYFIDTFTEEDILRVEKKKDGAHREYVLTRLQSLIIGISQALQAFAEEGHGADIDEYLEIIWNVFNEQDPLKGDGSNVLFFVGEENLEEQLEKLRAA